MPYLFYRKQARERLVRNPNMRQSHPDRTKPNSLDTLEQAGLLQFLISAHLLFGLISFEAIVKKVMLYCKFYWVKSLPTSVER